MTSKVVTGIGRSNTNFTDGYINGSENRRHIRLGNTSTAGFTMWAMRGTTATQIIAQAGPGNAITGLAVSRSGGIAAASNPIIAACSGVSPRLAIWSYPGGTSLTSYTLGTALGATANDVDITDPTTYNTDPRYVAVATAGSGNLSVYKITQGSSTATKLANPTTLPTGTAYGVAWNPAGTVLAVRHATSPFLSVYTRSGDTLTKVADPSLLPVAPNTSSAQVTNKQLTWNASGDRLMLMGTANTTQVYSWDGTTLTRVYSSTSGTYEAAVFHPKLDDVVALMNSSGSLGIAYYNKSTNSFTGPSSTITFSSGRDIRWHPDGTILTMISNQSNTAIDYNFRYQSGLTTTSALTSRVTHTMLTDGCWLVY